MSLLKFSLRPASSQLVNGESSAAKRGAGDNGAANSNGSAAAHVEAEGTHDPVLLPANASAA